MEAPSRCPQPAHFAMFIKLSNLFEVDVSWAMAARAELEVDDDMARQEDERNAPRTSIFFNVRIVVVEVCMRGSERL